MISKEQVESVIAPKLEEENLFLVEVKVSPQDVITVVVDSDSAVSIESCIKLSKYIEAHIDRSSVDYELDVMSAGVGQPLRLQRQYRKNIGRNVDVVTNAGDKYKALLASADEQGITLTYTERVAEEGKKRKQEVQRVVELAYSDIKTTKVAVSFK